MAKISINLLPPEITTQELKKANFYKIQFAGIVVILVMVFLASLTAALRILQSRNITEVQAKLDQTKQRIVDLKGTQASLTVLKSRLTVINQYLGISSKQTSLYRLVDRLIPSSVAVNVVTIDKSGEAVLVAVVPDSLSMDNLIHNLTTKEKNDGKISQVSIESLNRGRDGLYRISFKIRPK